MEEEIYSAINAMDGNYQRRKKAVKNTGRVSVPQPLNESEGEVSENDESSQKFYDLGDGSSNSHYDEEDEDISSSGFASRSPSKSTVKSSGSGTNPAAIGPVPMQNYMKIVNKLQGIARTLEHDGIRIPIPQIAVVGQQSTGKTSVLEQIAEEQFLPRGSGTVTKCPVILQFVCSEKKRFRVNKEELSDARAVEKRIRQLSQELADRDGGISDESIIVEVSSPNMPEMTLIDLPGLIQVNSQDQPTDLPDRIEDLVNRYIQNENTIILVVASADADFQTSKGIRLAQKADRNGNRTLAVLTKLDKVDYQDPEEVGKLKETLRGRGVSVRLGIVGVVNRIKNESFADIKLKEASLLKRHFPEMASKHGIDYLGNSICKVQMHHIFDSLHDTTVARDVGDKREVLMNTALQFANDFKAELEGSNRHINIHCLGGGVSIKEILDNKLHQLMSTLDSTSQVTNIRFKNAISNSRGTNGINYLTELAFEKVAEIQIPELESACLDCLDEVYHVLRDEVPHHCYPFRPGGGTSGLYPPLQKEFLNEICKLLDIPSQGVKDRIKDYITTQAFTARTYHEDFVSEWDGPLRAALGIMSPAEVAFLQLYLDGDGNDTESANSEQLDLANNTVAQSALEKLEFLKLLVDKYFTIVKAQVQDHIPKIMKRHLIFYAADGITKAMTAFYLSALHSRREGNLIRESEDIIIRRNEAQTRKKMLEDALAGCREVKDMVDCGVMDKN